MYVSHVIAGSDPAFVILLLCFAADHLHFFDYLASSSSSIYLWLLAFSDYLAAYSLQLFVFFLVLVCGGLDGVALRLSGGVSISLCGGLDRLAEDLQCGNFRFFFQGEES